MDFGFLKKGAQEGMSLFNRAKQFTGEKLGGADKTNYDANLEILIRRSDMTKALTERIVSSTTSVLQPNPNERLEDFVMTKLDHGRDKQQSNNKPNNLEQLGHCFSDASQEIGTQYPYGAILSQVGNAEIKLGQTERAFASKTSECLLEPLKSFLEGQMKTIQKEKRTLEIKRLDLDACKHRLKKLTEANPVRMDQMHMVPKCEEELRAAQAEFDRQSELTKLLMDELQTSYNHHLQCLTEFVDAQQAYFKGCSVIMQDLSKQISNAGVTSPPPINPQHNYSNSNNTQTPTSSSTEPTTALSALGAAVANATLVADNNEPKSPVVATPAATLVNAVTTGGGGALIDPKKAKVLFDYEKSAPGELSVFANQIIEVQILANDKDWVLAESGRDQGKVPKTYIQLEL